MLLDIGSFLVYWAVVVAGAWFLAGYMFRVYRGDRVFLSPVIKPLETAMYRLAGSQPLKPQGWLNYTICILLFNFAGFVLLYSILRLQHVLPLNPQAIAAMPPPLAFNTAISFVTNTNWQAYGGESQLSYFSQMVGLTSQNFVSAATGMAIAVAVVRGFTAKATGELGNFWKDLTRSVLYILLPLSIIAAAVLAFEGVPQTLGAYVQAQTAEGGQQLIGQGPVASQIAIKQLGTNGGGFYSVNSAHPLENPTLISNFLQSVYILLIPVAFCFLFGRMTGENRQGTALFLAMAIMFGAGLAVIYASEAMGNPAVNQLIAGNAGNMEGKEVRFGVGLSSVWAQATTAASNGSVNAMHDSFMPLSGLVMLVNMQIGEVIFGGVGAGLYGMLLYVVLAVFLAGLMVGRTPEYLGKKIERREVTLCVLAFLSMPIGILIFGAFAATIPEALKAVQDPGPHGLSEILYAYSSAAGNNGSAFGGYGAGSAYHTTMQGIVMLIGRYAFIVPMLAVAGALSQKTPAPATAGTFPTHGAMFIVLLILTILILGALTFFPVLLLGPLAEQTSLAAGQTF